MSHTRPRSARLGAVAAALSLALVATACGDDDDATTAAEDETSETSETTEAAAADTQEYCDLVEEMDGQDGPPTEAQLEKIKEIRPDEIGEATDRVADALLTAEGDYGSVFSDPAVQEDIGVLEEHDARVCGFETSEGEEEPDTEPAEGAQVIPVTGVDFAFEGIPAEVPAGPVAFEFTNNGEAAHEMAIFKLGEGVELDPLLAAEREPTEEEATEAGGTFSEPGGEPTYANTELEPGTYAVVCFIPGPEGKAHYELGMKTTFEVG